MFNTANVLLAKEGCSISSLSDSRQVVGVVTNFHCFERGSTLDERTSSAKADAAENGSKKAMQKKALLENREFIIAVPRED